MDHVDYSGKVLNDRYTLSRLLGRGGMGSVYIGKHNIIGKKVAVKFLHAEFANSEEVLKRFYREAQAAASIGHKNIIDVMDVGVSQDGEPYLVMEYLEGEDLDGMLDRNGVIDLPTACGIMEQALLALGAAHDAGIIHRDLKPGNIFLVHQKNEAPLVKLIDFGISKFTQLTGQEKLTQTGSLLGTPSYMSPEQAMGSADIDARADIYAMGVIFYQMLTNELPFEGENYNELLVNVLTNPPRPPSEAYADFPIDAEPVVMKELSKDPADRSQNAEEFIAALKTLGAYTERQEGLTLLGTAIKPNSFAGGDLGSAITAEEVSAVDVLAKMAQKGTPGGWSDTSNPPPKSNKTLLAVVMVALAVVVLGAVGVVFLLQGNKETPAAVAPAVAPTIPAPAFKNVENGVEIHIKGLPEGARIFFDKAPVPMNPFRVAKEQTLKQIKVEASGFQPFVTSFVPSKDQEIEVALESIVKDEKLAGEETSSVSSSGKSKSGKKKSSKEAIDDGDTEITSKGKKKITSGGRGTKFSEDFDTPKKKKKKKLNKGGKGSTFSEDFE